MKFLGMHAHIKPRSSIENIDNFLAYFGMHVFAHQKRKITA